MGLQQLPDELLLALTDRWPCRDQPLRQLNALLSPRLPGPSTLVVYGPSATGKTAVTRAYLEASGLKFAFINCSECVTGRHLLEKTVAEVHRVLQEDKGTPEYMGRCENMAALTVHLQRLLEKQSKLVLVLDGIDKQREAPPTLLPALARLGEIIPTLATVLVVQHPAPRFLQQSGVPHIHFSAYNRTQAVHIVSQKPPDIFLDAPSDDLDYDEECHKEDKAWLWPRYCAAVWDSLAQNAARDLLSFRDLCHKIWRPFVEPIITGQFGTKDFSRLLVNRRSLFQDESVLLDTIAPVASGTASKRRGHDLPYYAKWLLLSAYLSSFNPARLDALYFMKTTEKKRRKKGGGIARTAFRPSQNRKIPRHLLAASAFTMDRLLSILHAILPHDLRTTIDIYTQIATLTSLRLLVRSGGIGSSDPLEPGGKWRVGPAVSWEYAQSVARSVDLALMDYVAE
ncbi:Origin recognition complex subunit 5 [Teratosphaeria destructans]|uniref:Origin recognition complex subunit 5 n=1 Tax=Teratosphaeria destructans TaxID=418781 RepID=A0A9W7SZ78_9PEZI|nr:Origin recognition complex subunit 5 [Teratosphaeria destructans]